jgi:hypothetical protein
VDEIEVYGASWCPDHRRAKRFLSPNPELVKGSVDLDDRRLIAIRQYLENKDRN